MEHEAAARQSLPENHYSRASASFSVRTCFNKEVIMRSIFRRIALGGLLASAALTGQVSFAQCVGGVCSVGSSCSNESATSHWRATRFRPVRWLLCAGCHRHCRR